MMKRTISAIAIVCSLLCICLYTRTTGVYFIAEDNEIKIAIWNACIHLEEVREHLAKCKYIQILKYMEEAQAYIEEEEYISAIEVLAKGAEETGDSALVEKEKDLREHIVIKKEKIYRADKLREEDEYDITGNIIQRNYYSDNSIIDFDWYLYDGLGNNTEFARYDSAGNIEFCYEYEYDENGNQIKSIYYDGNSGICYEHEYDENEKEIQYTVYNSEDGSIINWKKYEWEYDETGNATKYIRDSSDGSSGMIFEAKYDEAGNIVKIINYDDDNNLIYWKEYEYEYRESKSLQKETFYRAGDNTYHWEESIYDKAGNQTEHKSGNAESGISSWNKYTYNETGKKEKGILVFYNDSRIPGKKKKEIDGHMHYVYEDRYEYDAMGNLIKATSLVNNEVKYVYEYEYEYVYVGAQAKAE